MPAGNRNPKAPCGDFGPISTRVAAAVDSAMILLEKKQTVVAGEKQLVNALAEFRKLFREKFGACSLVCGLPGFSPVIGAKNPDRRDPDEHPVLLRGIDGDRMQAKPSCTRLPPRAAGMVR